MEEQKQAESDSGFPHYPKNKTVTGPVVDQVLRLAWLAEENNTFGVGGVLLGEDNNIIYSASNSVIQNSQMSDPTAHVECQLVRNFQKNIYPYTASSPDKFTIISSLEPCAMCAGAIIDSGLNCVALSEDKLAGIFKANLSDFPRWLAKAIERQIGFSDETQDSAKDQALKAFEKSLSKVKKVLDDGIDDYGTSPEALNILARYSAKNPNVCLYGPQREFLIGSSGFFTGSIADDPVMTLVRLYSSVRASKLPQGETLPHPRHCQIVMSEIPSVGARFLMQAGALGSFLEGPSNSKPTICCHADSDLKEHKKLLRSLPPLYREIINLTLEEYEMKECIV